MNDRPSPTFRDPFHKPRKASRLARLRRRLRYRVWRWIAEGEKASHVAHPIDMHGKIDRGSAYCYSCGTYVRDFKHCPGCGRRLLWWDRLPIIEEGKYIWRITVPNARRLLLALALAMAGCGGGVAVWVVWGG